MFRNNPLSTCDRCQGTGRLPHYGHIANGVCFACNGTGQLHNQAARPAHQEPAEPDAPRKTKKIQLLDRPVVLILGDTPGYFEAESERGDPLFSFSLRGTQVLDLACTGTGYLYFGLAEDRYGMFNPTQQTALVRDLRNALQDRLKARK